MSPPAPGAASPARTSPARLLATWLGSGGWVPRLPAAVITLCCLPALPRRLHHETHHTELIPVALLVVALLAWLVVYTGLRAQGGEPRGVVFQHVLGLLLASLLLPVSWVSVPVIWVCYQLVVLLGPWPVAALPRALPSATGLVLAAVFAGLWANLAARTVLMVVGF
jgi:phosphatidylglycerophosphatase A